MRLAELEKWAKNITAPDDSMSTIVQVYSSAIDTLNTAYTLHVIDGVQYRELRNTIRARLGLKEV